MSPDSKDPFEYEDEAMDVEIRSVNEEDVGCLCSPQISGCGV